MKDKTCDVCGSDKYVNKYKDTDLFLCTKHRTQMKKYGRTLERTKRDPNEFVLYDDFAEIVLCNRQNNEVARTKIDLCIIEKVKPLHWCFDASNGYVVARNKDKKKVFLHRFIMDAKPNQIVDHISRDKLNNTCLNLRFVTPRENSLNSSVSKSKYECKIVGVIKRRDRKDTWYVKTQDGNVYFNNEDFAIEFRLITEVENGYNIYSPNLHLYKQYNIKMNPEENKLRKQELINYSCKKGFLGAKGVHCSKSGNKKYVADLYIEQKLVYWESFFTLEDAINARLLKEVEIFGYENAPQKHLFEEYGINENELT